MIENEVLLQYIKNGQPLPKYLLKNITTPSMPSSVMTAKENNDTHETEIKINVSKWIHWIEDIVKSNKNPQADMSEKLIDRSPLNDALESALKDIEKHKFELGEDASAPNDPTTISYIKWKYMLDKEIRINLMQCCTKDVIKQAQKAILDALQTKVEPDTYTEYDASLLALSEMHLEFNII